jgi:hypothetical protein
MDGAELIAPLRGEKCVLARSKPYVGHQAGFWDIIRNNSIFILPFVYLWHMINFNTGSGLFTIGP